jgi:hypothetical protein
VGNFFLDWNSPPDRLTTTATDTLAGIAAAPMHFMRDLPSQLHKRISLRVFLLI